MENIEVTDGAIRDNGDTINTPVLLFAIRWSSLRCVLTLMRRGVSTECVRGQLLQAALENNDGEMIRNLLAETRPEEDRTYALQAAKRGHLDVLDMILQHKPHARTAKKEETGDGLLHLTARSEGAGSVCCLNILLDKYSLDIEARNKAGRTPLHVAALGTYINYRAASLKSLNS